MVRAVVGGGLTRIVSRGMMHHLVFRSPGGLPQFYRGFHLENRGIFPCWDEIFRC